MVHNDVPQLGMDDEPQMLLVMPQNARPGQAFRSPQCARPWNLWACMRLGEIHASRPWYGENFEKNL